MILIDANLLIYASVETSPHHKRSRDWLADCLNGRAPAGLPWTSLLAFMRILTNPRITSPPVQTSVVWSTVRSWLACECVWIPEPSIRHADILGRLLALPGMHTKLIHDAHLAALAIEHGLTLCSADTDFARFPGLKWMNPLAG